MPAIQRAQDWRSLDRERKERLILALAERKRRMASPFRYLYPEEDTIGPDGETIIYAREKYPAQMEFYRVSGQYREVALMAANRCITPWTYLETDSQPRLSADIWTSEEQTVLAWDGGSERSAQSAGGILKCIEPAFRLLMDNGRFFDCTRKHRVLTAEGWLSLDRLVSRAGGLRWWHKASDYQASCERDGHLGDRPLQSIAGIDLESPPSQGGAQARRPLVFSLLDAGGRTLQHIRACPVGARLTTRDDLRQLAGLFSEFSGPSCAQPVLRLTGRSQALARLVQAYSLQLRSSAEGDRDLLSACQRLAERLTECCGGSYMPPEFPGEFQDALQSCSAQHPGGSVQEWFRDDGRIAIFFPLTHIPLVGGARIVSIAPIGLQPIIDANVEKYSNYKAAGVYHHNTGKTLSGAFAVTSHLTGEYRPWWEGKRFSRPIRAWAAGKTNETTRDIVQTELLGSVTHIGQRKSVDGTGMIPRHLIGDITWKQGVADLVDTVKIKHITGGWSTLGFKSYQQGRGSFEGTEQDVVWLDEECPMDIYTEALTRLATTQGILLMTFTPLAGMSETAMQFLPAEQRPQA